MKDLVHKLSSFGYIIASTVLFLIAIGIVVAAIVGMIKDITSEGFQIYLLLDEVGLIIFSIAVIDVCKYLITEEVLKKRDEKVPKEARKALTKFAIIIATALSLEGLVLTIEVAKKDMTLMLYPVSIMLTATMFIIGIGVYQRLNASAEKEER